ncbi:MAG: histidine kinase [Candidatus Accumulibacter sp.]|jgi:two-component system sensor histidine kinase AlgZ|nr:histidine kinase [Accumulibacter sp.]
MSSIKHYAGGHSLPDFRNLGVMLRILLGVNLCVLAAALVQSRDIGKWMMHYVSMAAWAEPLLLSDLVVLCLSARVIRLLPTRAGQTAVILLAILSALLQFDFWRFMGLEYGGWPRGARVAALSALTAGGLLLYFEMRARIFSPALSEARLQALTARIRPHFLFNSLNAVLSLIRSEPRRAEMALEELADLFRALMRDHRELVPLADEIALCRQYLDLEKLRLGDRLEVEWEVDAVPADVKVPPLMLQPLLENAVYHGIEPSGEAGTMRIGFTRKGDELRAWLANPSAGDAESIKGNGMALANIRERLSLYYDLEARLETRETTRPDGSREYRVDIVLPCREPRP